MSYRQIDADEFCRSIDMVQEWIKTMMEEYITPHKNKYRKMLDLGCGTCESTKVFAQYFKPDIIFGLDKEETFLTFARNNDENSNINIYKKCDLNVENEIRDVLKGHFDVDLVVSSTFFHWLDNPMDVIKAIHSVVPGTVEHVHLAISKCRSFVNIFRNIPKNTKWKKYLKRMSYGIMDADEFNRSVEFSQEWSSFMMEHHVTPQKNKYRKMLDLGCGTGKSTKLYYPFFKPDFIIGLDKEEIFLTCARNNDPHSNNNIYKECDLNVEDEIRDVLKDHFDVDLVVSSNVFHWLDNPIDVIKAIHSVVPGTVEHVHLAISKCRSFVNIYRNIPKNTKWKKYLKSYYIPKFMLCEETIFPSDQFLKDLETLNFRVIKECRFSKTNANFSYDEQIKYLKWCLPYTNDIPIEEQDEFLHDCWLEMTNGVSDKEAKYIHQYEIYAVHFISS